MGIKFLIRIGRGVLHTPQHVPSLRFIVRSGIKFLIRIGRGVLHTPRNVSGGSIIYPWSWAFVGRMQHASTWTIELFSGIGFNKCVFIKHLSHIDMGILHTSRNVSGGSIICPWSWVFVGRMQYAPTRTIQSFPEKRFNKHLFIRYLSRTGRSVLHTPRNVSVGSIICL